MAITVPVKELQDMIVGALGAPEAWLNRIVNFDSIPGDMPVGTSKVSYLTTPTGYTVAKGETAIRADGGASSTATVTTVQKYYPIEFYDHELARLTETTLRNQARKVAHAVLIEAGTAIIDAVSDAAISQTHEIYETDNSRNNFASAGVAATQAANAAILEAAISDVASVNPTPWILAHPTAWYNLRSYSRTVTSAPVVNGPLETIWNGTPMLTSQKSGTAAKWGANAKPCVIVGCNDAIGFSWQMASMDGAMRRRDNGVQALEFSITYSYALIDEDNIMSEVRNWDVTT